jgi:hypothetical protein
MKREYCDKNHKIGELNNRSAGITPKIINKLRFLVIRTDNQYFKQLIKVKTGLIYALIISVFSLLFASCESNEDYYSLDDIWISMGIIDKPDNGNGFEIFIDNGDTIVPVVNDVPYFSISDNQRVMVNYTILDEAGQSNHKFWVKINNLYDVILKDVIELTASNNDSIGNDPVHIEDIWISKNFLNVEFRYLGGEKIHFINLTRQGGSVSELSQPLKLELRHNAHNDSLKFNLIGIVTFDLKKLKIPEQDSVIFLVKSIDYKGNEHTFNGTYYY